MLSFARQGTREGFCKCIGEGAGFWLNKNGKVCKPQYSNVKKNGKKNHLNVNLSLPDGDEGGVYLCSVDFSLGEPPGPANVQK